LQGNRTQDSFSSPMERRKNGGGPAFQEDHEGGRRRKHRLNQFGSTSENRGAATLKKAKKKKCESEERGNERKGEAGNLRSTPKPSQFKKKRKGTNERTKLGTF